MFADVIVPLPLEGMFTYFIPEPLLERMARGVRVIVPFGQKKYYTAIVARMHDEAPEGYEVKSILDVLDSQPVMTELQLKFWAWLADYYLCTIGDVYKAAIPSGMKPESETIVVGNSDFEGETLSGREAMVWNVLQHEKEQSLKQLQKYCEVSNLLPTIKALLEKNAIFIKEEVQHEYRPKMETRVRLSEKLHSEKALQFHLNLLQRAPKQVALLMCYLELTDWNPDQDSPVFVPKAQLLKGEKSTAAFNELVKKQILEPQDFEVGRLQHVDEAEGVAHTLTPPQQRAYDAILSSFEEKNVCLLHGVTSSGKTEIYSKLIQKTISEGKQVLYLLPEIALTTQITNRLRRVFGTRLGVYHSKFPDAERVEVWQKQMSADDYDVILGVRSSLFLPFRRLGLVIVDEEHETTYKQQDPAPRYHARNAAIMLAAMHGAKTLLGTATPSIETYYNATTGKYGWVELTERHQQVQLPHIHPVDIKELSRKKRMNGVFSPFLLSKIKETVDAGEQVILFQNRRGFAPMLECGVCGWVPKCQHCDVSLTYHKGLNQLTCHYCGAIYQVPHQCPACEEHAFKTRGVGTEKVEDEIRSLLPEVKVARMDLDTTRSKTAYDRILDDFQEGRTQLLVGTQMISKGLDFDNVSVVGILNADTMLNFPDFRAHERAFQLMAQVAGRAGRRSKQGLVVLQTKSPDLPLIDQVIRNDYKAMFHEQLAEREAFHYPPFYRLIYVYMKHRHEDVCEQAAQLVASYLRQGLEHRVLGPDKPIVGRVQSLFIKKIVLKLENDISLSKVRTYLQQVQHFVRQDERFRSLQIYFDVDPM